MSQEKPKLLHKTRSWSPDINRENAWRRQKACHRQRKKNGTKSLTEDDIEELVGCIDLGFGFKPNSPDLEPKLLTTLPALEFYCTVNKYYDESLSRTSSSSSLFSDSSASNGGSLGSPVFESGDDPEIVKRKLKHWAKVVACSAKHMSG